MRLAAPLNKATVVALILLLVLALAALSVLARPPQDSNVIRLQQRDASYLGIKMDDVTADNLTTYKLTAERGAIVKSVEKGSPAEAANLQENDVILEYAGTLVHSTRQLRRLVEETPIDRKVDLVVSRDGRKINLSVKIGKREGPWSFGAGNFEAFRGEPHGEFRFEGPRGRIFEFGGPGGRREGPFSFSFPRGDELFRFGKKPRLGVTLEGLTDQMGEYLGVPGKKGAMVTSVTEGSPAAAARLKAGDVIVLADGKEVQSPDDLARIVEHKDPGQKLELKIIRDKREMTLSVELPKEEEKRTGGYRV